LDNLFEQSDEEMPDIMDGVGSESLKKTMLMWINYREPRSVHNAPGCPEDAVLSQHEPQFLDV
jgi:hypothetical protein